jgi:hypothetical protein
MPERVATPGIFVTSGTVGPVARLHLESSGGDSCHETRQCRMGFGSPDRSGVPSSLLRIEWTRYPARFLFVQRGGYALNEVLW